MHLRKAAWRNVLVALALVTFALPLATPLAQTASAQSVNPNPLFNPPNIAGVASTVNGNAGVNAAAAFNPIGTNHTVTFVCNNAAPAASVGTFAAGVVAGCYSVTASVQNSTTGDAGTIAAATCRNFTADISTATVQCFFIPPSTCPTSVTNIAATPTLDASGACLVSIKLSEAGACTAAGGTITTAPTATANGVCTLAAPGDSTMAVTINSGTPNVYTITYSGYVPAIFPAGGGAPVCPAGTTGPVTTLTGVGSLDAKTQALVTSHAACQFFVSVQKKYVEITNVTLTPATCGPNQVVFSEGLKSFFGPPCVFTAVATGTVVLKTGVNCANEPPAVTAPVPAEFGTGAAYQCVNGALSVVNVPSTVFSPGGQSLPFTFTITGPGSLNSTLPGVSFNGFCAGTSGASSVTTTGSVTVCSTGIGSGTVQACYTGGSTVNTQPQVCSAPSTFTFTSSPQNRIIPYVRWAGEKIVLTKCFGGAGLPGTNTGLFAGALVQFSLQANSDTQAILLPAAADVTGATAINTTGPTGGASALFGSGSNTVYTTADQNGCASVIAYARNEGVVDVDAAIYSTVVNPAAGGVQLVNEHAFSVYFLKFERVDLENIQPTTYDTAKYLAPALTFTTQTPTGAPSGAPGAANFPSFSSLPATFVLPNPPGTGQVAGTTTNYAVPICNIDYVRAMVHGYFEMPGDPSGRPASNVALTGSSSVNGTGTAAAGSYVLPAGR
ncbi:MAG TPA: hypothetical protein VF221_03385, partial [Chloroflexota bacterium]